MMRVNYGGTFVLLYVVSWAQLNGGNKKDCGDHQSMAIVLYDPSTILPMHRPNVEFQICNRTLQIKQQWSEYGLSAVVWDAAPFLCYYLEKMPNIVAGKRVIELGAGTGLVGMVANILGASNVTVTDVKTASAECNIQLNIRHLNPNSICVSHLEWGQRLSTFSPPYDVILAADVIYIEESFGSLLETLTALSDSSTTILISCRHRYKRVERFLDLIAMDLTFSSIVVWKENDLNIYQLQKSKNVKEQH